MRANPFRDRFMVSSFLVQHSQTPQTRSTLVRTSLLAAFVVLLAGQMTATADEPAPGTPAEASPGILPDASFVTQANRWTIWCDAAKSVKAELKAEPVFRWTNESTAGRQEGCLFLWTQNQRPVAAGGIFSHTENGVLNCIHECHTLSTRPLVTALADSSESWSMTGGIELKPIPGAPLVADTLAKRTLQLRAITREFTAHAVDIYEERWQLRLIPKPIYRYEAPNEGLVDGALFALLSDVGTDPEIILMLEAYETPSKTEWRYSPIRLSISDLYLQHKQEEVWQSLKADLGPGWRKSSDGTYRLINGGSFR
jgi:hypothetical protein